MEDQKRASATDVNSETQPWVSGPIIVSARISSRHIGMPILSSSTCPDECPSDCGLESCAAEVL